MGFRNIYKCFAEVKLQLRRSVSLSKEEWFACKQRSMTTSTVKSLKALNEKAHGLLRRYGREYCVYSVVVTVSRTPLHSEQIMYQVIKRCA